jgi:chromosome segregation ATPase
MDKETLLALADMLDDAEATGYKIARLETRVEKAEVEVGSLRERYRSMRRTAEQAENEAATLEAMLEEAQEKAEKTDEQFIMLASYNGTLHKMLQDVGIEAPTLAQFISGKKAEAALEIEEEE